MPDRHSDCVSDGVKVRKELQRIGGHKRAAIEREELIPLYHTGTRSGIQNPRDTHDRTNVDRLEGNLSPLNERRDMERAKNEQYAVDQEEEGRMRWEA